MCGHDFSFNIILYTHNNSSEFGLTWKYLLLTSHCYLWTSKKIKQYFPSTIFDYAKKKAGIKHIVLNLTSRMYYI
jgi:hypothetical protein